MVLKAGAQRRSKGGSWSRRGSGFVLPVLYCCFVAQASFSVGSIVCAVHVCACRKPCTVRWRSCGPLT